MTDKYIPAKRMIDELCKRVGGNPGLGEAIVLVVDMAAEVPGTTDEVERLRAELEAATKQINAARPCRLCVHRNCGPLTEPCVTCSMVVKQCFVWANPREVPDEQR